MTTHVITVLHQGIVLDPLVFNDETIAGQAFESIIHVMGFRRKEDQETWTEYKEAFSDWEENQKEYDRMDFEIHWSRVIANAPFDISDYTWNG